MTPSKAQVIRRVTNKVNGKKTVFVRLVLQVPSLNENRIEINFENLLEKLTDLRGWQHLYRYPYDKLQYDFSLPTD